MIHNARAERYTSPLECNRRSIVRLRLDPKLRKHSRKRSDDIWISHLSLLYKHFKLDVAHELPWMKNSDHSYAPCPLNSVLYESSRMDIRSTQTEGGDADPFCS